MKNIVFLALMSFGVLSAQQVNQLDANGKKHGLWKGTYEQSKRPRFEGTFEHGKEVGTFKFFDDTKAASVIATREFRPDGSAYTIFFDQKKNKVSEGLVVNKEYEGEWKYYHYQSPDLMTQEFYKNGKLEGTRTVYYKSGKVAEVAEYKNGKKHGIYKKMAENDNPLEIVQFVNGIEDGPAAYYNPDGTFASKGNYVNGAKKGTWEFYKDGKVVKKEKYPLKRKFQKMERESESEAMKKK